MADRSTVITPPGDTAWVYDPQHNQIDFISNADKSLYTYDLSQGAFTRTLSIGGAPTSIAISPDGRDLFIGNAATEFTAVRNVFTITRFDQLSGRVDQVWSPSPGAGGDVLHIAVDLRGWVIFNTNPASPNVYQTFPGAPAATTIEPLATVNALLEQSINFGAFSHLLTSPDHRYVLMQSTQSAPSQVVLYDATIGAAVAKLDSAHFMQGFQSGRGDVTNGGMVVDVASNTIQVFDKNLALLHDFTSYSNSGVVGAAFSQDGRDLFIWNEEQKTVFAFDTQTWAQIGTVSTTTGGVVGGLNAAPAHAVQVVDHGTLLALDDGVHGVELIDLAARFGLSPGAAPAAPDPSVPLPRNTLLVPPGVKVAGDMDNAHLSDLLRATITAADDSHFSASGPGALAITLAGTGFAYANNQLVGGVVNTVSFTDVQANVQVLHFEAAGSWSAPQFQTWLVTNDTLGAFQNLLANGQVMGGSTGADLIHGYGGDDEIWGGGGADKLFGGLGNDLIYAGARAGASYAVGASGATYIRGEEGDDYILGGQGFDDINGNMGDDTASGGLGDDWVVGGKDNDILFGDAGDDVVYGNMGNDTCVGGAGADQVRGGQDSDVIYGGDGNDWLSGDRGSDTISGGAGADIFHTFSGAGIDRVVDFSAAEGDRVQLDPGATYNAGQVGADIHIDMGGGDRMVLVGVQLSTLPDGWLFVA